MVKVILGYNNKTYIFNHIRSFIHFRWLLYRKFDIHPSEQIILYNGQIIRSFPLNLPNNTINVIFYKKLLGGSSSSIDGGIGNMLLALGGSISIYWIGIFLLFFMLELFVVRNPNSINNNNDSTIENRILSKIRNKSLYPGNSCSLLTILQNNNSMLLMMYLIVGFFFWIFYSSNLTMFLNEYFINNETSSTFQLISAFLFPIIYVILVVALYNISNNMGYDSRFVRFIDRYSIFIFILMMIILIALFYYFYISNIDFNKLVYWIGQITTTIILMTLYFYLIVGNKNLNSYWVLFLILPLLGLVPYIVFYIVTYLELFHK